MSSTRTRLTELATAAGLLYDPSGPWPESIESLEIPGIPQDVWQPVVLPATTPGARDRELLFLALQNGHAFRQTVLHGRAPGRVDWVGPGKTTWTADVPRDLTVDHAYFIQAKYNSTCVLNKAPTAVFDHLLLERDEPRAPSWFETVAAEELQRYYEAVRDDVASSLPDEVARLSAQDRQVLKLHLSDRGRNPTEAENARYAELCRVVSERTADRWQASWSRASRLVQSRLVIRLLRVSGGPYWLLGTKGRSPVRLAVTDARDWLDRFDLRSFVAAPGTAGQPQVNWHAEVRDKIAATTVDIDGYCEVRWTHRKLQSAPECKVQVTTPLADLPGYDPLDA